MKKFLLLAGKPIGSLDIINYAKEKGAYTIVCDYLDASQSPAKQLADETWDYSTADVEGIVRHAKKVGVDSIFTGVHEFNIKKCLAVCKELNLPFYATEDEIAVSSKKNVYKKIFEQNGIDIIKEFSINVDNISDDIIYPIIIKPVDGSGAYGISICNSKEELLGKIREAEKHSEDKQIIAERYLTDKEEITTVYFIIDGTPYLASVADRLVKTFDEAVIPLPVGYIWPSKYLSLYCDTVDEKMKNAIREMGLQNGMLFIQSIVKDGIIYPYDIGFRLSGTQEHLILEEVCGYSPLKLLVDYAFEGEFPDKESLIEKIDPEFKQYACNITFLAKPSTIHTFEGLDEVVKMEGVIRLIKNKLEGETIPESALGTLNQVAIRVFAKANDLKSLNRLIEEIVSKIKVLDEHGNNILIPRT